VFGRVRGFQIPARKTLTLLHLTRPLAVASICLGDSALHGPAITHGTRSCGSHFAIGAIDRLCVLCASLEFFKAISFSKQREIYHHQTVCYASHIIGVQGNRFQ